MPDERNEEHEQEATEGRAVAPAERITTRYMTKYEKARILGTRALQLRFVFPRTVVALSLASLTIGCLYMQYERATNGRGS